MKMLIIRPQPGADATAEKAGQMGIEPIAMPLFAVQPMPWTAGDAGKYDALIITSANAVRHGGDGLKSLTALPAYAVGKATEASLIGAGFTVRATGDRGASALVQLAVQQGHKRLLWLTGEDHSAIEISDGVHITKRILYRSARLPAPQNLRDLLSKPTMIALHSTRAAEYFAEICTASDIPRGSIILAAYSPIIAAAAGDGWAQILIADQPNDGQLLSKANSYFTSAAGAP